MEHKNEKCYANARTHKMMSPCCYVLVSSIIELADSVHKLEVSSTQKMEK